MRFRRPQRNQTATLKIILMGTVLMLGIDFAFFDGLEYFRKARRASENKPVVSAEMLYGSEIQDAKFAALQLGQLGEFEDVPFDLPHSEGPEIYVTLPDVPIEEQIALFQKTPKIAKSVAQKIVKLRPVDPVPYYDGKAAKIVIIIDDLGMGRKNTYQTLDLPAPMTLAFLPYAPQLEKVTGDALAKGHELLIHVPMQPMKKGLSPGPIALMDEMSEAELKHNLDIIFDSFDGYIGINNHMGSQLTQNSEAMGWVMEKLAERDLVFVDSKTIATSVAAQAAAMEGLEFAERDVFLDHEDSYEFVMSALDKLETRARSKGYAIAIGHPKENTIRALKEWLPTLDSKNLELVSVSEVVQRYEPVVAQEVNQIAPAAGQVQPQRTEREPY